MNKQTGKHGKFSKYMILKMPKYKTYMRIYPDHVFMLLDFYACTLYNFMQIGR
jgi:hypothetical protein